MYGSVQIGGSKGAAFWMKGEACDLCYKLASNHYWLC